MRKRLVIFVLWMVLGTGPAHAVCGLAGAPDATFYQPLAIHGNRSPEDWDTIGRSLKRIGIQTIYVQWSILNSIALFPLSAAVGKEMYARHISPLPNPPLPGLLAMAERNGIGLWIGLDLDPSFFQVHERNPDLLRVYFLRRELALEALLPDLGKLIATSPALRGWYITDELDDLHWQDTTRLALLTEHLAKVTELLSSLAEHPVPVAISGFSNGRTSPSVLAEFWDTVLTKGRIDRLLFQDSIGAGKLSVQESTLYRDALAKKLGQRVHMVVEAFSVQSQSQDGSQFSGIPASTTEMHERLRLAMGATMARPVLFSAPEYLLPSVAGEMSQSGNISTADRDRRARALYDLQAKVAQQCMTSLPGVQGVNSR
ncbi:MULTISPECIES: DUF4434 domain-containing protein [unclassified Haematospirillum]|uniref:DUF4434 domain-containing protein n=1 Tax=unclassified Haematospirillum TaxID=2622088 RepID=UPI00143C0CBD|nr:MULTISPECIES: DUF4434 domain-containing protein [unclassified Haematospirillum]NKD55911.1 DUF4434 domain-containing protein [Haematospirillum sp. H4890]NKD75971.1 DUF4434 domain-containing protein [Haematospirillum sp. H4485]